MPRFSMARTLVSADAAPGLDGADGTAAGASGVLGTAGGSATSRGARFAARDYLGGAAEDVIEIAQRVEAGQGGRGGQGGDGVDGTLASTVFGPLGFIFTYGAAGSGADARSGGHGGAALTVMETLTFHLGGVAGPGGADTVALVAEAIAGNGGVGGAGGSGASTQGDKVVHHPGGRFDTFVGAAGGNAGDGAAGGNGANALAALRDIGVLGEVVLSLDLLATGGHGGAGGAGGRGATLLTPWGAGDVAGSGGAGGAGGDGGRAVAELAGLSVAASAASAVFVTLLAEGGNGGAGGAATPLPARGSTETVTADRVDITLTLGGAVDGGAGGDGGGAIARIVGSAISLGDESDLVSLSLHAAAGAGAAGGAGSLRDGGFGSSTRLTRPDGSEYTEVVSASLTPRGQDGTAGAHGAAIVHLADNSIALGGGDDQLMLALGTTGAGADRRVILSGNDFDGGDGQDSFVFWGDVGLTVNVAKGWVAAGRGGRNDLAGFERFQSVGGTDDVFTDGAGAQTYEGGGGADRFLFGRGHGRDVVSADFDDGAVIVLRGFGLGLDDFSNVLTRSLDVAGGVRIVTGADSSIDILGVARIGLRADMFDFA